MFSTSARFNAALLGCALAAISCLSIGSSRRDEPARCTFDLPELVGPWELVEETSLQGDEVKILHAHDHWRRRYRNRQTEQVLDVTLIAGPAGPLASHVPEACYTREAYGAHSDAAVWVVPEQNDRFRLQTLVPRRLDGPAVTVAYGWDDGQRWRAPAYPRIQLAGEPGLQRLLVTMQHPAGRAHEARQTLQQFLQLTVDAARVGQSTSGNQANSKIRR